MNILGLDGKPIASAEEFKVQKSEQLKSFIEGFPKGTHHLAIGVSNDEPGQEQTIYYAQQGNPVVIFLNLLDAQITQILDSGQYEGQNLTATIDLMKGYEDILQQVVEHLNTLPKEAIN